MNDGPIVHPEAARLKKDNEALREQVTRLLSEVRELMDVVRPNLLALFQKELGRWELKVLEKRFEVARLQRTIELGQAALNRGELPDMGAIRAALEREVEAWKARIREAVRAIDESEQRLAYSLSVEDDKELKRLFRELVKRLHPDLHPDADDEARGMWHLVIAAWERSDLNEMRALHGLVKSQGSGLDGGLEALNRDNRVLREHLGRLAREIEDLQGKPPFTLQELLDDHEWVESKRSELDRQADELQQKIDVLVKHLESILGGPYRVEPGPDIH